MGKDTRGSNSGSPIARRFPIIDLHPGNLRGRWRRAENRAAVLHKTQDLDANHSRSVRGTIGRDWSICASCVDQSSRGRLPERKFARGKLSSLRVYAPITPLRSIAVCPSGTIRIDTILPWSRLVYNGLAYAR